MTLPSMQRWQAQDKRIFERLFFAIDSSGAESSQRQSLLIFCWVNALKRKSARACIISLQA